ncbi:hypothetical protein Hanom_Chr00s004211g01720051 [Helianthus anomalus]
MKLYIGSIKLKTGQVNHYMIRVENKFSTLVLNRFVQWALKSCKFISFELVFLICLN